MKADKIIAAEQMLTLGVYVASDLIGQQPQGGRGLPSPKIVVGVLAFFGLLSFVSSLGRQPARVSAAVGGVVTLLFLLQATAQNTITSVSNLLIDFLSTGQSSSTGGASSVPQSG